MILYSAKSTIDAEGASAYRVTKFADGEVESSYLTNGHTCDCPAGVRPTCRHRQMLPEMIHAGIINTRWFLDWDTHRVICDFEGTPKALVEAEVAPADLQDAPHPSGLPVRPNEAYLPLIDGHYIDKPTPVPASPKSWRRI